MTLTRLTYILQVLLFPTRLKRMEQRRKRQLDKEFELFVKTPQRTYGKRK